MIWQKILNRLKNRNFSIGPYIAEIFLIILSILIAIQADRCNQSRRNDAKLQEYLQSMYQDLLDEQIGNKNNLGDCRKDISSLERALQLSRFNQNDSLDLALKHLAGVFSRGVFRTFPPTTFDIMRSTGDISLVKDLQLRNKLAATFSFRDTYVKNELQGFDDQIKESSRSIGRYVDLACLASSDRLHLCVRDREGFVNNVHNELFMLLRMAQVREFHLRIAVNSFEQTIIEVEDLIKPAEPAD